MAKSKLLEYAGRAVSANDLPKALLLLQFARLEDPANPMLEKAIEHLEKSVGIAPGSLLATDAPPELTLYRDELAAILGQVARSQLRLEARLGQMEDELYRKLENLGDQLTLLTTPAAIAPLEEPAAAAPEAPLPVPTAEEIPPSPTVVEEPVVRTPTQWLAQRGVTVKSDNPGLTMNAFGSVAEYLGKNFKILEPLYEKMKRSRSLRYPLQHHLQGQTQETIQVCTQFCNILYELAILSNYWYDRNNRVIHANLTQSGEITNFINGGWLEIYIARLVENTLNQQAIPFTKLYNPIIDLGNGDTFELDLLYLVRGKALWLECKTGDYQNYVQRYSDMRSRLGLNPAQSILVVTRLERTLANSLSRMHPLTFTNLYDLPEHLAKVLDVQVGETPALAAIPVMMDEVEKKVVALLKRQNLRPQPEVRIVFLQQLVNLFQGEFEPARITEHKDHLANALGLSKSQVQELLNAAKLAGIFLGETGEPMDSFLSPTFTLVSYDVEDLNKRMLQAYAKALEQAGFPIHDPDLQESIQKAIEAQ